MDSDMRTPQGRNASAMRASSWIISGSSVCRFAVDVVDGDAVEADRGQQPAVLGDPAQVRAHVAIVEENAAAGVAALDASVEVIPLIDPANGRRRRLRARSDELLLRDLLERPENAVEFATVAPAGDHPVVAVVRGKLRNREAFGRNWGVRLPGGEKTPNLYGRAEDECAVRADGG